MMQVKETLELQSIQETLNSVFSYHERLPDYRCNLGARGGCNKTGYCSKVSLVTELRDVLVIQLPISSYNEQGHSRKCFLQLTVTKRSLWLGFVMVEEGGVGVDGS